MLINGIVDDERLTDTRSHGRNKQNYDIIEETYYNYHGEYAEGSEKEEFDGFHIIEETEEMSL